MPADTRVAKVVLQYQVDTASASALVQSNKAIAGSFNTVADAAKQYGLSAEQVKQLNDQLGVTAKNTQAVSGLLSQQSKDTAAAAGFMKDLADIQKQEADALGQTDKATQALTADTQKLASAYDAAAKSLDKTRGGQLGANDFSPKGGDEVSGSVGSIRNLRQSLIALPGVGFQSPIVVGLRGVELAAQRTGAGAIDLAGSLGIAGVGIIAAKAVLDAFTQSIQRDKDALAAATAGTHQFFEALAAGNTTSQVTEQIDTLNRQREAEVQELTRIQGLQTAAFQQSKESFGDLGARLLDTQTPVAQLRGEAEKLQAQVQNDTAAINALTAGIENNAFAAADAAKQSALFFNQQLSDANEAAHLTSEQRQARIREINNELANIEHIRQGASPEDFNSFNPEVEKLKQERQDLAKYAGTLADALAYEAAVKQKQIDLANIETQAQSQTNEQRQAAAHGLEAETSALQEYIQSHNLSADTVKALTGTIAQNEAAIKELNAINHTYADDLDNEKKLKDALKQSSDELNKGLQDLNDIQVKLGAASAKSSESLQALRDSETEHSQNLKDIEAERDDAIEKARTKASERIEDIEKKSGERIADLRAKDDLTIQQQVASGNIAAAQQTLARQRLDIAQQKRQDEDQKTEAKKTRDDAIEAANEHNEKLLKSEAERYDKEYRQRVAAHQNDLQEERALINAQEVQRANNALRVQYWNNVIRSSFDNLGAAAARLPEFLNTAAQALAALSGTRGGSSGGGTSKQPPYGGGTPRPGEVVGLPAVTGTAALRGRAVPTPFAEGGYTRYGGLAMLHPDELVLRPADRQPMQSSNTLVFQVGEGGEVLAQKIVAAVRPVLEKHGEQIKVEVVQDLTQRNNKVKKGGTR